MKITLEERDVKFLINATQKFLDASFAFEGVSPPGGEVSNKNKPTIEAWHRIRTAALKAEK